MRCRTLVSWCRVSLPDHRADYLNSGGKVEYALATAAIDLRRSSRSGSTLTAKTWTVDGKSERTGLARWRRTKGVIHPRS